jgi:hypothetical protein
MNHTNIFVVEEEVKKGIYAIAKYHSLYYKGM